MRKTFNLIKISELPKAKIYDRETREKLSWFKPIDEPIWHAASNSDHMKPDDPVLGLYLNGKAWAMPWWIMKNHHVANLILDNQPILVTFCEACSSASAFEPTIEGNRYTFGLIGMYNGSIMITDRETESLWRTFSGEALYGSLKGTALKRLPLYQCRWSEWLEQHPNSSGVYGEQPERKGHGSQFRPGSSGMPLEMATTLLQPLDRRLPSHTLVLGVNQNSQAKAYPLLGLDRTGVVVGDRVGQEDIAIFHPPGTFQAIAFSRRLNGEVLDFEQTDGGKIIDKNTRSSWNYFGEAYEGKLAGDRLSFVDSGIKEWAVWSAYYPDTELFSSEIFQPLLCFSH